MFSRIFQVAYGQTSLVSYLTQANKLLRNFVTRSVQIWREENAVFRQRFKMMNALVLLLVCVCEAKEKLDKRFRPKFGKIINFDRTSTLEPIFYGFRAHMVMPDCFCITLTDWKGSSSYPTYSSWLIITSNEVDWSSRAMKLTRANLFSATKILKIKLSPRTSDNLGFALWRLSLNQYNQNSKYIQTFSHIYLKVLCSGN